MKNKRISYYRILEKIGEDARFKALLTKLGLRH